MISFRKRQHINEIRSVSYLQCTISIVACSDQEIRQQIVHSAQFNNDYSVTKSEI